MICTCLTCWPKCRSSIERSAFICWAPLWQGAHWPGAQLPWAAGGGLPHPYFGVPGVEPLDAGHRLSHAEWFAGPGATRAQIDPARMAQGIMTGIGFLGWG